MVLSPPLKEEVVEIPNCSSLQYIPKEGFVVALVQVSRLSQSSSESKIKTKIKIRIE